MEQINKRINKTIKESESQEDSSPPTFFQKPNVHSTISPSAFPLLAFLHAQYPDATEHQRHDPNHPRPQPQSPHPIQRHTAHRIPRRPRPRPTHGRVQISRINPRDESLPRCVGVDRECRDEEGGGHVLPSDISYGGGVRCLFE